MIFNYLNYCGQLFDLFLPNMNQLETSLPVINEAACNYAVLEYEINQLLKEFDCPTEINDTDEKTISYLYKKLAVLHNQVKILKARVKNAETERMDHKNDPFDSEWEEGSHYHGSQETNIEFGPGLINDYDTTERKSQFLKLENNDNLGIISPVRNDDIMNLMNLKPVDQPPAKYQKNTKNSFYPMSFLYSNGLISKNYLSKDLFMKE